MSTFFTTSSTPSVEDANFETVNITFSDLNRHMGALKIEAPSVGDHTIGKIHRSSVDAPELANNWGTSLAAAELTLKTTSQHGY